MNKKQKWLLWLWMVLIIANFVYPPWVQRVSYYNKYLKMHREYNESKGYRFVGSAPSYWRLDFKKLAFPIGAVSLIIGVALIIVRED